MDLWGPWAPSFCFTASPGSLEEATLSLQTILGNFSLHFLPSPSPSTSARPLSPLFFSCFSITLHYLPTLSKPLLRTSSASDIMQSPEDSEPRVGGNFLPWGSSWAAEEAATENPKR